MAIRFELLHDEEIVAIIQKWKDSGMKRGVALKKARQDWNLNNDEDLKLIDEYVSDVYDE